MDSYGLEPRAAVRRELARLVAAVPELAGDPAPRRASEPDVAALCRVLGADALPAAVDEYLRSVGGEDTAVVDVLHAGATRPTVRYLADRAADIRRAAPEMGADPARAAASLPLTWTAEAIILADLAPEDPAVWYVLEDGTVDEAAPTFTAWLAEMVDLEIENRTPLDL